ncbi:MAG: family transcriptional regulator [Pseudomonadota bacterium]|nr:family transcriptional regulator [Pseudomonadota bacterium]
MKNVQNVQDTRRDHLRRLMQGYSSQRQFADAMGLSASYINQILTGVREMGGLVSRRIETALGLPEGYFDTPLSPPANASGDEAGSASLEQMLIPTHELKLLADYRRLSKQHQKMLRETAAGYLLIERENLPSSS